MQVGDRIKVIDQEIYGKIVKDYGTEVVIEDEDAPTDDNTLCFKKSEVEEIYSTYEKLELVHWAIQEAINGNMEELSDALEIVEQLREPYLKKKGV
jgi:predicted house-cleaning noncanonical NTP pyrophosphatase (MazG superfamily)|tara:strand:- start:755 stop:1042 length:288 start_codon:yes stop_codon:yes gene_type:complete